MRTNVNKWRDRLAEKNAEQAARDAQRDDAERDDADSSAPSPLNS